MSLSTLSVSTFKFLGWSLLTNSPKLLFINTKAKHYKSISPYHHRLSKTIMHYKMLNTSIYYSETFIYIYCSRKRYDTLHIIEGPGFDSQSAINLFLLYLVCLGENYLFIKFYVNSSGCSKYIWKFRSNKCSCLTFCNALRFWIIDDDREKWTYNVLLLC